MAYWETFNTWIKLTTFLFWKKVKKYRLVEYLWSIVGPTPSRYDPHPRIAAHLTSHIRRRAGRKRAVCIGIDYKNSPLFLHGCVNDAETMRRFLIERHNYHPNSVLLLTDSQPGRGLGHFKMRPTAETVRTAMRWLVDGARPEDIIFLQFSGHGGQILDKDRDEVDGKDELIYTLDERITDDELKMILVKHLPLGCRLTAVFDSCHSGSILDLPHVYGPHGQRLENIEVTEEAASLEPSLGTVVCWSACKDSQLAQEGQQDSKSVGAMCNEFMKALREKPDISCRQLLSTIQSGLASREHRDNDRSKAGEAVYLGRADPNRVQQVQLSTSQEMDMNRSLII